MVERSLAKAEVAGSSPVSRSIQPLAQRFFVIHREQGCVSKEVNMIKPVILFIHGFMGSTRQFDSIEPSVLHAGAEVRRLVLPGHEGTLGEFCRSGRKDWLEAVRAEIRRLEGEHSTIILVGHSMGGLMSVLVADEFECVKGVVAIAFPLYPRQSAEGIKNRIAAIKGPKPDESILISEGRRLSGVSGFSPHNSFRIVPNTLGLLKLMRLTRKKLPSLATPLTVINSVRDELVSPRSAAFVRRKLPAARCIEGETAYHFLFAPNDIQVISDEICCFI